MLSVIEKNKFSKEEAIAYNEEAYRLKNKWGGCISQLACIHCGSVIKDSTCLCVGYVDCPVCKNPITMTKEEKDRFFRILEESSVEIPTTHSLDYWAEKYKQIKERSQCPPDIPLLKWIDILVKIWEENNNKNR